MISYLKKGYTLRDTAKLSSRSLGTVQKVKKYLSLWSFRSSLMNV